MAGFYPKWTSELNSGLVSPVRDSPKSQFIGVNDEDVRLICLEDFSPTDLEGIEFSAPSNPSKDGYRFVKIKPNILVYTKSGNPLYFYVSVNKSGRPIVGVRQFSPEQLKQLELLEEILLEKMVLSLKELALILKEMQQRGWLDLRLNHEMGEKINCELRYGERRMVIKNTPDLEKRIHGQRRPANIGFAIRDAWISPDGTIAKFRTFLESIQLFNEKDWVVMDHKTIEKLERQRDKFPL
jgi:hypothetical protein